MPPQVGSPGVAGRDGDPGTPGSGGLAGEGSFETTTLSWDPGGIATGGLSNGTLATGGGGAGGGGTLAGGTYGGGGGYMGKLGDAGYYNVGIFFSGAELTLETEYTFEEETGIDVQAQLGFVF